MYENPLEYNVKFALAMSQSNYLVPEKGSTTPLDDRSQR